MSTSHELRVFISSTFRDMQEEREHLVKKVFPEVRAICRERGVTFTEIDLRWGLTREEAERGGVIPICMQEIERCRPFFIGILGGRYGWVPPREQTDDPDLADRYPWLLEAAEAGLSITEMEFRYGALMGGSQDVDAFFYLRDPEVTPAEFTEHDASLSEKLERLKSDLRTSGFPVRDEFRTPEELGEQIRTDLLEIIDERFPIEAAPSPTEQERNAHDAFARTRRAAYVPDEATVTRLDELVTGVDQGICVTAPSGTGKSALLAYWSQEYRTAHPDHNVIEHYVGATAAAQDRIGLMLRLITEIRELYGVEQELPESSERIEGDFSAWLAYAREKRLVVVIDAVNQLPLLGQELHWLPEFIPPAVTFVLSTTEGPSLDALRSRDYAVLEVDPLSEHQRATVIERYLSGFRKRLTPDQVGRIAVTPNTRSPLFLRTVIEELRVFGVFEQLDERIDYFLAATDLDDLFHRVLERMERDYDPELVQQTMMYIWASRAGLTESELQDLMNLEPPLEGMSGRRFTRLDLSAFLMALDYHLMRNAGLLNFFHAYLRRAVETRYLEPEEEEARDVEAT